ncbi:thiopurine S-methyltransferase [Shewanella sp. NIFS-20-20]|uniref:thiopurine S-methyltransferase n=1 Tax=Shewanella sp. NIFS-20-20 TaxID=2853806 RepID=UPI001C483E5E|nr:thiopurine S-methyltransferase [Shewanella sp. NIFS-20-20]MBV7317405.1 thiopurine S-methyltransferase [Shewanella sp. NIFS-20-20]
MDAAFWHERWHNRQIGFHQTQVNPLLQRHWPRLQLDGQGQIWVPLCGKSVDMLYLAELGYHVLGCELSELAVREFFSDNQLTFSAICHDQHQVFRCEQIELWQGDYFTFPLELSRRCVAFYDRAAMIAMPSDMRQAYAMQLAQSVSAGTQGLLITLDYPQAMLDGPPFAVSQDWLHQSVSPYFDIELLESCDVLADNPKFLKKQVPRLTENAYLLTRRGA